MQVTRVWSLGIHKTSKQNERQWSIPRKISCLREKRNHRNCVICSGRLFAVQSFSHVQLFVTQWLQHARQAPLSSTVSQSLLQFMSIESVVLSNHLILCHLLLLLPSIFPSISIFFQWVGSLPSGGQSFEASALASVLPTNIQGWFPLGLTRLTCLQSQRTLKSLLQNHSSKATTSS